MSLHKGKSRKKKHTGKKFLLTSLTALFLGAAAVGTSLAFLIDDTLSITNIFTGSEVKGEIEEEFDRKTKENVKIKNTGDVDAYIRVALIPSWVDDDDNIYGKAPVLNEEYCLITLTSSGADWFLGEDGYYYYKNKVVPEGESTVLIEKCEPLVRKAADGRILNEGEKCRDELHFELHVVTSLIQAEPGEAVEEAWGVTVDESTETISK